MLYALENETATFGLTISSGLTKSMSIINSYTTSQSRTNAIVLNGHPVEEINQFTHLASAICKDGDSDADEDCKVGKPKEAIAMLSRKALQYAYLKAYLTFSTPTFFPVILNFFCCL